MTFKERLAAFKALFGEDVDATMDATDDATPPAATQATPPSRPHPAPPTRTAPDEAAIRAQIEAEFAAKLEERLRADFQAKAREDAAAYLAAQVKAEKITPADVPRLAALFSCFSLDDRERPIKVVLAGQEVTYSRLAHFKDELDARGASGATTEFIGADKDAAVQELAARGRRPLPGMTDESEEAALKSKAYVAGLLGRIPGDHQAAK